MLRKISAIAVLALMLSGCDDNLTREKAAKVILKAGSPIALSPEERKSSVAVLELVKLEPGYRYSDDQGALESIYKKMGYIEEYRFQLKTYVRMTEKGKKEIYEQTRPQNATDFLGLNNYDVTMWQVPFASAKFSEVTGISPDSKTTATIRAKYIWERNEVGKLIQETEKKEKSVVGVQYLPESGNAVGTMRYFDDGWRLETLNSDRISAENSIK
jgi:hypothetical protein